MKEVSRRDFLVGSAGMGALAALGLAGCAPKGERETAGEAQGGGSEGSARPDWLGEAPEIAESDIAETKDTAFLIVGAGNAGMAAAATACELGLDFALCEKNSFVMTTREFFGAVDTKWSKEAGFEADRGTLLNELARYASFKCNMDVLKTWINESGETFEWLEPFMAAGGKKPMFQGPSYPDPYESGCGGGKYYVPPIQHQYVDENFNAYSKPERNELLQEYIEGEGKEILFGHCLVKLEREDGGRVTGGIFETENGFVRINASKGVLIATGGYPANPDMINALLPIVPKVVTTNGYMTENDGLGIKAAMWIGADKQVEGTAMIFDRGGVDPDTCAGYQGEGDDRAFPGLFSQVKLGTQPFMKVNREGRRFVNESCPYDFIAHAASEQTDGVWCQIFDANAKEDIARFATTGCSNITNTFVKTDQTIDDYIKDWAEAGVYWKADTLEELADMLKLPKDEFLASVERYNALYDAQKDEDFGKEAYRLSAIRQPPFYGGWFGGNLLTTLDGLRIDGDCRVLDAGNKAIEGLFAAGDCSGGIFCGNYPEWYVGVAVGRTVTFGRHVARLLAGDLSA